MVTQEDIIQVLRQHGPMTAIEIAEAIGYRHDDIIWRHRALSCIHEKLCKLRRQGVIVSEKMARGSMYDGFVKHRVVE